jgi:hypothetical protein
VTAETIQMADADRTVKLTRGELAYEELRAALADVKDRSDPGAARRLMEYFYGKIHDNLPYDHVILFEYLEHVFGRILRGESADHVFGSRQSHPREA